MNAITERPTLNVYQRINAARNAFHSLKLKKTGHNKFAGYYYFELGDFLPKTQEIFNDIGLCGTVAFTQDIAVTVEVGVLIAQTAAGFAQARTWLLSLTVLQPPQVLEIPADAPKDARDIRELFAS